MDAPERWKRLVVAPGLLIPLLVLLLSMAGFPDAAVDGDAALLEIGVRQTIEGDNVLGPYSRFRFHHPGPAYFYAMSPLYLLLGRSHGSFLVTAVLLNLVSVWLIFRVVRPLGMEAVLGVGVLTSLLLASLGADRLISASNPEVPILAFGAALFSFAAAAAGRGLFLAPAVILASLAVQSHLAYAAPLGLAGLVTLLALLLPRLVGYSGGSPLNRRQVVGLLALTVLLWLPPLWEEFSSDHGNLSKLMAFFSLPHQGTPASVMVRVLAERLVSFLSGPVRVEGVMPWTLVILVAGLVAAYRFSLRRGRVLAASLCLVSFAGLAGAAFSIVRIVGPVHDYLVGWVPVLGLVAGAAMTAAFLDWACEDASKVRSAVRGALWVFFAVLFWVNLQGAWAPGRLRDWPHGPKHRTIERLADMTHSALAQSNIHLPEVRIATTSSWATTAGVLLRLDKLSQDFCVEDAWLFQFGEALACRAETDGLLIFGDRGLQSQVQTDSRFRPVAAWDEGSVFISRQAPEPEAIDFSGPDSVLYLKSGFSLLDEVEKGDGRWSVGSSSSLTLRLRRGSPYRLEILMRPLWIPGRTQIIRFTLNGTPLTQFPLVKRELPYTIILPAALVGEINELGFDYAYAEPPMLHYEQSGDWRPLGVFFRLARIIPGGQSN